MAQTGNARLAALDQARGYAVAGMGFRLSFRRRAAEKGLCGAHRDALRDALRRYGILMGLGLLCGGSSLLVGVWDALMGIGAAGAVYH